MKRDLGLYDYADGEEEYQRRLAALAVQRRALEGLPQRPAEWIEEPTGETYAEAYARMSPEQRRSLLLNAGICVYVSPHSLDLHVPRTLKERVQKVQVPALAAAS